jgi:hypothetical protein
MGEITARNRLAVLCLALALTSGLALGCIEPNPTFELDRQLGALPPGVWELTGDLGLSHVPVNEAAPDDGASVPASADAGPPDALPADAAPADDLPVKGKLCDPCKPQQPDCTEPGGLCLIVNDGPSFCTKPCARHGTCPDGYECLDVQVINGSALPEQCVPISRTCD